jgi:hypothetical protein
MKPIIHHDPRGHDVLALDVRRAASLCTPGLGARRPSAPGRRGHDASCRVARRTAGRDAPTLGARGPNTPTAAPEHPWPARPQPPGGGARGAASRRAPSRCA